MAANKEDHQFIAKKCSQWLTKIGNYKKTNKHRELEAPNDHAKAAKRTSVRGNML